MNGYFNLNASVRRPPVNQAAGSGDPRRAEGWLYNNGAGRGYTELGASLHAVTGALTAYPCPQGEVRDYDQAQTGVNNTYGYDANGNQTTRPISGVTLTLSYDAEGRLVSVTAASMPPTPTPGPSPTPAGHVPVSNYSSQASIYWPILTRETHVIARIDCLPGRLSQSITTWQPPDSHLSFHAWRYMIFVGAIHRRQIVAVYQCKPPRASRSTIAKHVAQKK